VREGGAVRNAASLTGVLVVVDAAASSGEEAAEMSC
jgi:hypothetical protein